jgi:iron complex transport system substrate-binding protein
MRLHRAALVLGACFALACSRKQGTQSPHAVTSASAIPLATTAPARIVSLSPSTTEALFAIGAGNTLVGRSRYCDFPQEAVALPVVGGFVDPSDETILRLKPALVIGAHSPSGPALTERLKTLGLKVYLPRTESLGEIESMLMGLGERTQHQPEAGALVAEIQKSLAETKAAIGARTKVRTLLLFGLQPLVAAGPQGFPNEMIALAGGENVIKAGPPYPTIGAEQIALWDPDVVIAMAMREASGKAQPFPSDDATFRNLRAVRQQHAYILSDDTVLRPGPRIAMGVRTLAKTLHPAAFTDAGPTTTATGTVQP